MRCFMDFLYFPKYRNKSLYIFVLEIKKEKGYQKQLCSFAVDTLSLVMMKSS